MEVLDTTAAAPAAAPATTPAAPAPTASAPAAHAPTAAAPAAAPAATPAAAPAVPESLVHDLPGNTPAAAPAPGAAPAPAAAGQPDPIADLAKALPEKFQVKAGDKLDSAASIAKALEHRAHLEQRLGRGELPPKSAVEYQFKPPEELKDFEFSSEAYNAFREDALKAGFTQGQFELAMSAYLRAAPSLMEGVAKLTAAQARAELQKVWPVTADYEANIANASRAIRGLPPDLQEAAREFGTNPAFLRAMAHYGAQAREDTTGAHTGALSPSQDVETLRRSEAYMNPKHPDHARVSAAVKAHFEKLYGTTPIG